MNRASQPVRTNRCVLVSVEFSSRRRASSRAAAAARAAAQPAAAADLRSDGINGSSPDGDRTRAPAFALESGFDFESSREEFRELVVSAGGDVVAELTQRRPEADPA